MKTLLAGFPVILSTLVLILLVNQPGDAPGSPPEVITLKVTGSGATDSEAIRDAFRTAMRQAYGAFVIDETLVVNDELVEKMLSVSEGIVTDFQEIETQRNGGIITKRLKVNVERKRFLGTLLDWNSKQPMEDGRKLFTKVVSQLESEEDAIAMILKLLENYPQRVLSVETRGEPELVARDGSEVTLDYFVGVSVDPTRYRNFADRLREVCERVATRKGTAGFRTVRDSRFDQLFPPGFLDSEIQVMPFAGPASLRRLILPRVPEPWWTRDFNPDAQMVIIINLSDLDSLGDSTWRWYHVPRIKLNWRYLRLSIRFLDVAGTTLHSDELQFGPLLPGYNIGNRLYYAQQAGNFAQATQIIVSPYFLKGNLYSRQFIVPRTLKVDLDQLKAIRQTPLVLTQQEGSTIRDAAALTQAISVTSSPTSLQGPVTYQPRITQFRISGPAAFSARTSARTTARTSTPEELAAKTERVARLTVRAALALLEEGQRERAEELLDNVIKKYPDTKAAEEAQTYLKGGR